MRGLGGVEGAIRNAWWQMAVLVAVHQVWILDMSSSDKQWQEATTPLCLDKWLWLDEKNPAGVPGTWWIPPGSAHGCYSWLNWFFLIRSTIAKLHLLLSLFYFTVFVYLYSILHYTLLCSDLLLYKNDNPPDEISYSFVSDCKLSGCTKLSKEYPSMLLYLVLPVNVLMASWNPPLEIATKHW